jgi:hypothetical protein
VSDSDLNLGICAAMMCMQHECLVKFLGAGVMSEPKYGLRVLFTVQVWMLIQCHNAVHTVLYMVWE